MRGRTLAGRASTMRGVDEKRLRMESDGRLCPAHRHRPKQPTPQGVGAFAAIERDDRAATFGRVPRCLPAARGNKTRRAVQAHRGFLTHRAPAAAAAAWVHPLPPRIARRWTCSRTAAVRCAHVPAAQRRDVRPPVFKAMALQFTRYRACDGGDGRRHRFLDDERVPCPSACSASNTDSQSVTPGYRAVSRTNSCPLEALCTVQ